VTGKVQAPKKRQSIVERPEVYGRYLLIDRVSVGGMAEVFKAMTVGLSGFQKVLAIKRILPNIVSEEGFIKMFVDEANIAGILHHANIAQIYDLGAIDDSYFIAMEYVEGRDLRAIFDKIKKIQRPLPVEMSAFVCSKVLAALDYAHRKMDGTNHPLSIVHRDVSPPNILLSYEGDIKLIDFGIAKAAKKVSKTQAGVLKGKFGYMSPEQVRGMPVDGRSDVFSVGIVLWEMLAHRRLFVGETDFQTLEKVRGMDIEPPSRIRAEVPTELDAIVLKALERDVKKRYASAVEMEHDLQRFLYSRQNIFTDRQLAEWMHEVFETEILDNKKRMQAVEEMDLEVLGIDLDAVRSANVRSLRKETVSASDTDEVDREPVEAPGRPAVDQSGVNTSENKTGPKAADLTPIPSLPDHPVEITRQMMIAQQIAPARSLAISLIVIFMMLAVTAWYWIDRAPEQMHSVGAKGETADVTLLTNISGASVLVNDREVCTTPCRIVDFWAGDHVLIFKKEGFVSDFQRVSVTVGSPQTIIGELFTAGDVPGGMVISSDPPGASVWIDNTQQSGSTPLVISDLKAGLTYTVKIQKLGYDAQTEQVVLDPEDFLTLSATLAPETPSVRVLSDPEGANIFLNGENTRKLTPARLPNLTNGESYLVRLELDDHEVKQIQVTAELDREPEYSVILEPKQEAPTMRSKSGYGWVIIDSEPVAKIFIDGKPSGRYTPHKARLSEGPHRIRLENNNAGINYDTRIQVEANKTHSVKKTF
jgi:serine/threonine protein kinase